MLTRLAETRVTRSRSTHTKEGTIPKRNKHKEEWERKRLSVVKKRLKGTRQRSYKNKSDDQVNTPPSESPKPLGPQTTSSGDISPINVKQEAASSEETAAAMPVGFARGLEVNRIVAIVTGHGHSLHFLVEWKGDDNLEYVPAVEANRYCPQDVIEFYENHCFFEAESEETSDSTLP